jgi:enoyl-CoA hydratase/carnithine racemase
MNKEKVVIYEKKGPIAYITMNRPGKVNAMDDEMYSKLVDAIMDYRADDKLLCAIITGAGGHFSSGGDLKWFEEERARNPNWRYDFPLYNKALGQCTKPVISAVDGYCLASGFNLAVLYTDIRIASERAKFGMPVVKRGLGGDRVAKKNENSEAGYPMPFTWHMNLGNVLYMFLTGNFINAEQALHMGLVSEIVPHDNLMKRATELAKMVCECPPVHARAYKELFYRFMEMPGSNYLRLQSMVLGKLGQLDDTKEGSKAFIEKRKPVYKSK